jgi:hypothetical protein
VRRRSTATSGSACTRGFRGSPQRSRRSPSCMVTGATGSTPKVTRPGQEHSRIMHRLSKRGESSSRSLCAFGRTACGPAAEGGRTRNEPVQGAIAGGACWSSLDASAVLVSVQRCSSVGRRSGRCRSSCGRLLWPGNQLWVRTVGRLGQAMPAVPGIRLRLAAPAKC